jgi:hypothetical protein
MKAPIVERPMYRDPVVEEIRRHREARAAKFGFNIRSMMEDAMKREAVSGHPVVNLSSEGERRARRRVRARSLKRKALASS